MYAEDGPVGGITLMYRHTLLTGVWIIKEGKIRNWEGDAKRGSGKKLGGGYNQNLLYICMKFSNNRI